VTLDPITPIYKKMLDDFEKKGDEVHIGCRDQIHLSYLKLLFSELLLRKSMYFYDIVHVKGLLNEAEFCLDEEASHHGQAVVHWLLVEELHALQDQLPILDLELRYEIVKPIQELQSLEGASYDLGCF
jgi:hypothetical protein